MKQSISDPACKAYLRGIGQKLSSYCRANDWAGYDPYDALNSQLFARFPKLSSRIPRLVLTQALKRSPINIRPVLQIPKTSNPKALALFLSASVTAPELDMGKYTESLRERLSALRSPNRAYCCWGYSFPWQTRTMIVPRGEPNLVCTVFAANALLDLYDGCGKAECLDMAVSAADYILNDLYWTDGSSAGFSYPIAGTHNQIHNANLLGAALLCRVYALTRREEYLEPALKIARYSIGRQQEDGSWFYGEEATKQWIDNFHTGYNLCALDRISSALGIHEFHPAIRRGFDFYSSHFFRADGAARYFHQRTYPIDIHCVAQSIITLVTLRHLAPGNVSLALSVFRWATDHMWDERHGYFFYRVLRFCTIRTSYMRWSQAWMLAAISVLLREAAAATQDSRSLPRS